jgi:hypothetical protein
MDGFEENRRALNKMGQVSDRGFPAELTREIGTAARLALRTLVAFVINWG